VADEPLRKWPSSESVFRSFFSLRMGQSGAIYAPKGRDGVQRVLRGWAARGRWGLQVCVHLDKGRLRLREEVVHETFAKLALVLVVVHFEDLLKGRAVDAVLGAGNGHDVEVAVLSS
jgi:hypothetical protein